MQSSPKSERVYRTESYKKIKMYLKIQDIFTRPNEFLPDMSGGQTEFREDCMCFVTLFSAGSIILWLRVLTLHYLGSDSCGSSLGHVGKFLYQTESL